LLGSFVSPPLSEDDDQSPRNSGVSDLASAFFSVHIFRDSLFPQDTDEFFCRHPEKTPSGQLMTPVFEVLTLLIPSSSGLGASFPGSLERQFLFHPPWIPSSPVPYAFFFFLPRSVQIRHLLLAFDHPRPLFPWRRNAFSASIQTSLTKNFSFSGVEQVFSFFSSPLWYHRADGHFLLFPHPTFVVVALSLVPLSMASRLSFSWSQFSSSSWFLLLSGSRAIVFVFFPDTLQ